MALKNEEILVYRQPVSETLSFRPLIKYWKKQAEKNKVIAAAFESINERLKNVPELQEKITDFSIVENNKELIQDLLQICLPPGIQNESYAAVYPDRLESFYETPPFSKLEFFENQKNAACFNENCCITPNGRFIAASAWVLGYFYKLNINYEYPLIYTKLEKNTGLERHYRVRIFSWFCEIVKKGELKTLSEDEVRNLFENLDNPDVLSKFISPEIFEMEGFFIFNAIEITDQETISSLKFDLIGKESVLSASKFENLQHKLRALLKKPHIKLGLIAFPSEKKDLKYAMKMGNSILLPEDDDRGKSKIPDCEFYNEVLEKQEIKIIYDIKDCDCKQDSAKNLLDQGVRNLLLAPLMYKDELIGILEVASSVPGDLNKINILKLKDVYPLFALCIESSLDDLHKSIQSVIKEKCTAIHPSVEWRFRDVAYTYLKNLRNDIIEEMEDIVFENVHPFYGCSDIKDSSVIRNSAIQSDLIENLKLAKDIITKGSKEEVMPILEELSFRVSNHIENLEKGLNSGIEFDVISFIRNEVGSTFDYLKDASPALKKSIDNYKSRLDPKFGFLLNKRKEFEDSISLINETISTELEIQQDKAQKIFPHYFEKYKTDGVEYNMYIGSSMVSDKKFDQMHYKSLRLWQLVTMCIIAKKCVEAKNTLSIPLEITHLIFVQNAPISIRFLYDEKKFDVAGSYDLRHEIIKKRIDKALIQGCNERLVCPAKIAIVYSHEAEAEEYKQYINFLKTKKYITDEVESFNLEDMQGVQGLKALRITVNTDFKVDKTSEEKLFEQIS